MVRLFSVLLSFILSTHLSAEEHLIFKNQLIHINDLKCELIQRHPTTYYAWFEERTVLNVDITIPTNFKHQHFKALSCDPLKIDYILRELGFGFYSADIHIKRGSSRNPYQDPVFEEKVTLLLRTPHGPLKLTSIINR